MSKNSNKEKVCEVLRLLFLFSLFVNYVLSAFYKVLGIDTKFLPNVICFVYFFCFLVYMLNKPKGKFKPFIIAFAFLLLTFISCVSIDGLFEEYSSGISYFLFLALPCIVLFNDDVNDCTYNVFGKLCLISGTFFSLLFIVQSFVLKILNDFDYQSVSYSLIIPILYLFQKKKNFYEVLLMAVMLFFAVFMGGRGPLICILAYFIYHFLTTKKTNLFVKLIIVAGVIMIVFSYEPLVLLIAEESDKLGLRGSFSTYLKFGDIFSDSGRNDIYKFSFETAKENWLFGSGLFSDRILLKQIGKTYPHNVFLELLIQLGYPIAFLISFIFIAQSMRYLQSFNDASANKKLFDILFFSTGFAILLFSSSYLIQPGFFALFAILLKNKKGIHYEKSVAEL